MERPQSVQVFGILNICFAAIGVVGSIASIASLFWMRNMSPPSMILFENAAYRGFMAVSTVLGCLAAGVLLTAGIGLLKSRPWARLLAIGYAIYAIFMALMTPVATIYFVVLPMVSEVDTSNPALMGGLIGGAAGGVLGGCFGMIYPVVLLYFMFRRSVVEYFRYCAAASNETGRDHRELGAAP